MTATLEERKALLAAVGNPYGQPWASHHPIFAIVDQIIERVTDDLVGPCSGCSPETGPEEECPRHGRSIANVWELQQRALAEAHRLQHRIDDAINLLEAADPEPEVGIFGDQAIADALGGHGPENPPPPSPTPSAPPVPADPWDY